MRCSFGPLATSPTNIEFYRQSYFAYKTFEGLKPSALYQRARHNLNRPSVQGSLGLPHCGLQLAGALVLGFLPSTSPRCVV